MHAMQTDQRMRICSKQLAGDLLHHAYMPHPWPHLFYQMQNMNMAGVSRFSRLFLSRQASPLARVSLYIMKVCLLPTSTVLAAS